MMSSSSTEKLAALLTKIWEENRGLKRHVMLFGRGGSGKTTTLVCLWGYLLEQRKASFSVPLPIYIPLNQAGKSLSEYICGYYLDHDTEDGNRSGSGKLSDLFKGADAENPGDQRQFLLLLDGYDERAYDYFGEIRTLVEDHPNLQVLISARDPRRDFNDFTAVELNLLSPEIVESRIDTKDLNPELKELLRLPMYLSLYRESLVDAEYDKRKIQCSGDLIRAHIKNLIEKDRIENHHSWDSKEYITLVCCMESFFPFFCKKMKTAKKMVFSASEFQKIGEEWREHIAGTDFAVRYSKGIPENIFDVYANEILIRKHLIYEIPQGEKFTFLHREIRDTLADSQKKLPNRFQRKLKKIKSGIGAFCRKKRKKIILSAVSVLVVCCAVFAVCGIVSLEKSGETYHIRLYPEASTTLSEYNAALPVLEERLNILTAGEKYDMDVQDSYIDLWLPKESFGEEKVDAVLQAYIVRPGNLYLFNPEDKELLPEKIPVERDDMVLVTLKNGQIPGLDTEDLGITEESYPYFTIDFTEEFIEENAGKIEAWGEDIALGLDMTYDSYYRFSLYPLGDGETFCFPGEVEEDSVFDELMLYNMIHPEMSCSFAYQMDYDVDWEEDKEFFGQNQVKEKKVKGKTVTVIFGMLKEHDDEILSASKEIMKSRLDLLEVPYAFGVLKTDPQKLAVKIGMEHFGIPVMHILGKNNLSLRCGLGEYMPYFPKEDDFSFESEPGETLEMTEDGFVYTNNEADADYTALMDRFLGQNDEKLYLVVGNQPVMEADASDVSGNTVTFHRFSLGTLNDEWNKDTLWLGNLLDVIVNGTDFPDLDRWYMEEYQYNSTKKESVSEEDFEVSWREEKKIFEEGIKAADEDSEVYFICDSYENQIHVFLHLPVNELLPEDAISLVKEIYRNIPFEDSIFDSVMFYLIDEDDETNERARINFNKYYTHCFIDVNYVFSGGRLERYRDSFEELFASDPFFAEYTSKAQEALEFDFDMDLDPGL